MSPRALFSGVPDWPDFKTKRSACPACSRELDAATAVRHDVSPKDGDLSICIGCGTYLVFAGALGVLLLDAEAFAGLPAETQIELRRLRAAIRSQKGSSRS